MIGQILKKWQPFFKIQDGGYHHVEFFEICIADVTDIYSMVWTKHNISTNNDRCKGQDTNKHLDSHFSKLAPLTFHINAIQANSFKAHTHGLYKYNEIVTRTNVLCMAMYRNTVSYALVSDT